MWVATTLEIKEFLFTSCFSIFSCYTPSASWVFWLKCSAHWAGLLVSPLPPPEHWTHTWDLLKLLKVFFFLSLCFLTLKRQELIYSRKKNVIADKCSLFSTSSNLYTNNNYLGENWDRKDLNILSSRPCPAQKGA